MRRNGAISTFVAIVAAALAFVLVGLPTGVIGMVDPRYCFDHDQRSPTTSFHEEELSLFPPGPACRFVLDDGTEVVEGPGWWPTVSLVIALLSGILVLRLWRRADA